MKKRTGIVANHHQQPRRMSVGSSIVFLLLCCMFPPNLLLLSRLSLSKTALGEALFNTDGNVGWDQVPELVNITTINDDVSTDSSGDDVAWESEEVVGDLGGTEIFGVETSDEDCLTAVWVELLMDGTLWEDVHLEGADIGVDDTGAVLEDDGGVQVANNWDVQLGTTRMGVWGIETAWAEEAHSHTGTGTDQSWEGLSVGNNDTAGITGGDVQSTFGIPEIEDEVTISEQGDTIGLEGSDDQLGNELQVAIGASGVGWLGFNTTFVGLCRGSLSLLDLVWSWSSQDGGSKGGQDGDGGSSEKHFRWMWWWL